MAARRTARIPRGPSLLGWYALPDARGGARVTRWAGAASDARASPTAGRAGHSPVPVEVDRDVGPGPSPPERRPARTAGSAAPARPRHARSACLRPGPAVGHARSVARRRSPSLREPRCLGRPRLAPRRRRVGGPREPAAARDGRHAHPGTGRLGPDRRRCGVRDGVGRQRARRGARRPPHRRARHGADDQPRTRRRPRPRAAGDAVPGRLPRSLPSRRRGRHARRLVGLRDRPRPAGRRRPPPPGGVGGPGVDRGRGRLRPGRGRRDRRRLHDRAGRHRPRGDERPRRRLRPDRPRAGHRLHGDASGRGRPARLALRARGARPVAVRDRRRGRG